MKNYTVKVFEDGSKVWLLNGERHREDGPAIEFSSGTKAWYLNGEKLTEKEHMRRTSGVTMEDARLIAAAPDLLEALEKMVGLFEPGRIYDFKEVSSLGFEALKTALAAIAKAKGEEHERKTKGHDE